MNRRIIFGAIVAHGLMMTTSQPAAAPGIDFGPASSTGFRLH
jgi:hypothetical protein